MKIYASAKIKDSQEVISFIRAFYAECNGEESSYEINCKDLKMEMDTKYVPAQTITAICKCDEFKISSKRIDLQEEQEIIVVLPITEDFEEDIDDEALEEVTLEDEDSVSQDDSKSQETDEVSEQEEIQKQDSGENNKKMECAGVRRLNSSIPELKEILTKSNSIEEDIDLVAEFFDGLGKKKELFKRILEATLKIEPPVSWKKLNEALNIIISTGLQNRFNKEVMSKLGMTILNFVKMLAEENFAKKEEKVTEDVSEIPEKEVEKLSTILEDAGGELAEKQAVISGTVYEGTDEEQSAEVQEELETSQEVQGEHVEQITEKPRIKMECMPEIPWFEEMLASIDKTLPAMEKVKMVLNAMDVEKLEQKWKWHIIETVYASIKFSTFELTKAMSKALVPSKEEAKVTMYMFQLINQFAGKYTESKEKISVESFLKDLNKVLSL